MKKYVCGVIFIILSTVMLLSCSKESITDVGREPVDQGDKRKKLSEIVLVDGNNVYGHVVDEDYNPIADVVMSDGYTVVTTNDKGEYQFKRNLQSSFVYYSTPADYAVQTSVERKIALFYAKLSTNNTPQKVDFVLNRLTSPEKKFTLFAIGDPQVANMVEVERFKVETMADIVSEINKTSYPVYGISLGDVVADQPSLFNVMKSTMGSTNMPLYTTIGNHDKTGGNTLTPRNSTSFESHYGPLNYSFNRGDVHFVCLDNVVFTNNSSYALGFSDEQMSWLEQDLSFVPKTKMLILYYHMPIRNSNFGNRTRLLNLVKDFKEVHFMAGHTHYNENYIHTIEEKEIFEHVHAAASGAWWKSTINGDGTPNGYAKYEIDGNTIKEWVYKSTNYDSNFQMRLHWGNSSYGGSFGTYSYGKSSRTLIANVWNADPLWILEVFIDDEKVGNLTLNTSLSKDAWSLGYHLGVLNRNVDNYTTATKHLYSIELPNSSGAIKVVATDRFGNRFEETTITSSLEAAIGY